MKAVSGREFIKIIKSHGWTLRRITSSHHIFGKSGRQEILSVPMHGNKSLKKGLLKDLMKVAGLKEEDLS